MTHSSEDDLILFHYGESEDASVEKHLEECAQCRGELEALARDLDDVDAVPVPERGADYGEKVWSAIRTKLARRQPRRLWLLAAAAVLLLGTFLAGRLSTRWGAEVADGDVQERILLVALGEHLDRSEVLLLEVLNAEDGELERDQARELLRESRLYRQTAHRVGDAATGEVLDELERFLLDVAHATSRDEILAARINEQDVLFKIRVLQTSVRARQEQLVQKF